MILLFTVLCTLKLFSINPDEGMVERIIANPSAQTLGKKALAFYLTHPKTTDYVYQGADEIVALFKNYCEESKILIKRYLIDEFRKLSRCPKSSFEVVWV